MNDLNKTTFLGISFLNIDKGKCLELLKETLSSREKKSLAFLNAHYVNLSCSDEDYKEALLDNDFILPDGIGLKIGCRLNGIKLKDNLNGTDLLPDLCEICANNNRTVYLLGAQKGIAETMKENLKKKYPKLKICGIQHGYFDREKESPQIIRKINEQKPDLLLVAMGAPIQEKWVQKFKGGIDAGLIMSAGGLFDFYSGKNKRAPRWMRNCGLEWFYRLLLEPGRLWKRYIIGNPVFLWRSLFKKS